MADGAVVRSLPTIDDHDAEVGAVAKLRGMPRRDILAPIETRVLLDNWSQGNQLKGDIAGRGTLESDVEHWNEGGRTVKRWMSNHGPDVDRRVNGPTPQEEDR